MTAVAAPESGAPGVTAAAGREDGSRSRWRRPTLGAVAGLVLVVVAVVLGLRPLADNSFLTHLATGRLVLDGGVPTADPYTFTTAGDPWVVQSWLASTVYALVERAGGGHGLLLLNAALSAALTAMVWRLSRPAPTLIGRVVLLAPVMAVGAVVWTGRPALAGLVLFTAVLLALEGTFDPRWTAPLMWVWVNTHGSFPLGLVVIVLVVVGTRLDGRAPAVERRVLGWALVGMAAGAVNPLGPRLLVFPVELLGRSDVLRHVEEWQPPAYDRWWHWCFVAAALVAGAAVARRRTWRAALPLVVFTGAALLSSRNVALATIVAVAAAAGSLPRLGTLRSGERPAAGRAALALTVAVGALLVAGAMRRPAYDLDRYPVAAVAFAEERGLFDGGRVVTQDFVGNYLEVTRGATGDVFVDDRYDVWPRSLADDVLALVDGDARWEQVLARHGATAVVWERELPLAGLLGASPGWRVAYDDGTWVVAVRR